MCNSVEALRDVRRVIAIALLAIMTAACVGNKEARELSAQMSALTRSHDAASNDATATYILSKMKDRHTAQVKAHDALRTAYTDLAETHVKGLRRQQLDAAYQETIANIERDYAQQLVFVINLRAQHEEEWINALNEKLEPLETLVSELEQSAIEAKEKAEEFPNSPQRKTERIKADRVYLSASSLYFDIFNQYEAQVAEAIRAEIVEGGAGLAGIRNAHLGNVKRIYDESIAEIDAQPSAEIELGTELVVPEDAYKYLTSYLELVKDSFQSIDSHLAIIGFGKGSLFDEALQGVGAGLKESILGNVEEVSKADVMSDVNAAVSEFTTTAKAELTNAETTAKSALRSVADDFSEATINKLNKILSDAEIAGAKAISELS